MPNVGGLLGKARVQLMKIAVYLQFFMLTLNQKRLRAASLFRKNDDDRWNDDGWDDNKWNDKTFGKSRFGGGDGDKIVRLPVTASGAILVLCFLVFFIKIGADLVYPGLVDDLLAFNPFNLYTRPWTLITYMFDHGNFDHLLFNMIVLFFFGTELERRLGEKGFLWVYLLSGVVAALGHMLISSVPVIGASGAIFGLLGCLTVLAPDTRVLLFFMIPLRIQYAVLLFALIDFTSMGSGDGIAHMAHLVGLFVGIGMGFLFNKRPKVYYS